MAKPLLLVFCGALVVAGVQWGPSVPPAGTSEPPDGPTVAPTEDETLQNEADNQENVLSQVGGGPWPPPALGAGGSRTWPSQEPRRRPLRPGAVPEAFLQRRDGVLLPASWGLSRLPNQEKGEEEGKTPQGSLKRGVKKKNHHPNL